MEFTPVKDFLRFIKHPTRRPFHSDVPKPLAYVTILFGFAFTLNIIGIAFVNTVVVSLEDIGSVFDELEYGPMGMFVLAVIVAPIIEEFIFRFPLRYKIPLSILTGAILSGFVSYFIYQQGGGQLLYAIPLLIFMAIIYYFILSKNAEASTNSLATQEHASFDNLDINDLSPITQSPQDSLGDKEQPIDLFFPVIFYLVAITFALIHISNYDSTMFSTWMIPFIVIPQFILALFLGFVRMRIGFWACLYMHALNNCIPVLLMYAFKDVVAAG